MNKRICPLSMIGETSKQCEETCQLYVKLDRYEGCAITRYLLDDGIPIYEKIDSLEEGYS